MNLFERFEVLEAPRDIRGKKYKLIDILSTWILPLYKRFKIIDKYEVGERTISTELTYLNNRKTLLIAFAKVIDNHKYFGYFCKNDTNDLVIEFWNVR